MPSRSEVQAFQAAQAELSRRVVAEVRGLHGSLPSDPVRARQLLLDAVPVLVATYGDVSATVAAEWFEQVYGYPASMAAAVDGEKITKGVLHSTKHLSKGDPDASLKSLLVKIDLWVKSPGRGVVRASAGRRNYGWARVPTGAKTCAFCLIMASRGAVYDTRGAAGQGEDAFHGGCDCATICVRSQEDWPEDHDLEALSQAYEDAADAAGGRGDLNAIAAQMRRQRPDLVTDAVHEHDS